MRFHVAADLSASSGACAARRQIGATAIRRAVVVKEPTADGATCKEAQAAAVCTGPPAHQRAPCVEGRHSGVPGNQRQLRRVLDVSAKSHDNMHGTDIALLNAIGCHEGALR